jgi:hypothetical protein
MASGWDVCGRDIGDLGFSGRRLSQRSKGGGGTAPFCFLVFLYVVLCKIIMFDHA